MPRDYSWLLWLAVILIAVAGVIRFWDQSAFEAWRADLNPYAFFLLMTIAPAFGVPASPFYVLAGASFDLYVGLGGTALAVAANLLLVFAIGRSGLLHFVEALIRHRKLKLPHTPPTNPIRYTVIVKLAPGVPAFLKNYILVFSRVPFPVYFWISFGFSFFYALLFFSIGESLEDHDYNQVFIILGLGLLLGAAVWFCRKRLRRGKAQNEETSLKSSGLKNGSHPSSRDSEISDPGSAPPTFSDYRFPS